MSVDDALAGLPATSRLFDNAEATYHPDLDGWAVLACRVDVLVDLDDAHVEWRLAGPETVRLHGRVAAPQGAVTIDLPLGLVHQMEFGDYTAVFTFVAEIPGDRPLPVRDDFATVRFTV